MRSELSTTIALSAVACLIFAGCQGTAQFPEPSTGDTTQGNVDTPATGDVSEPGLSVGDVTIEVAHRLQNSGQTIPGAAALSARVYNGTDVRVELTLRFFQDDVVVHLAYLEVTPRTVTTVVSPEPADTIRVSGLDEDGRAVQTGELRNGIDFDDETPAVYRVEFVEVPADPTPDEPTPAVEPDEEPEPGTEPDDEPEPEPGVEPEPYFEPTIRVLEPAIDLELTPGKTLSIRWDDSSSKSGSLVLVGIKPLGASDESFVQLAPAISESQDGINDAMEFVIQGVELGTYDVIAYLDDGVEIVSDLAPGRLELIPNPSNIAPEITIIEPQENVELSNGEALHVEWEDYDPDSSASVTFKLTGETLSTGGTVEHLISPTISEDPEGRSSDSATLTLTGLLPGTYDLLATIDDGELLGQDRVVGAVTILPPPTNDVPQITVIKPSESTSNRAGDAIEIAWLDEDSNDNALISLYLDNDLFKDSLDGNEILLANAIAEDVDGAGDSLLIGIPKGTPPGTYRVVAIISDGLGGTFSFAPASIEITEDDPVDPQPVDPPFIQFTQPAYQLQVQSDKPIPVTLMYRLPTIHPTNPDVYLYSTNARSDDAKLPLQLLSADHSMGDVNELTMSVLLPEIPNEEMPRSYEVIARWQVGEEVFSAAAPGLVWVYQDVVVEEFTLVGVSCPDILGALDGDGVEQTDSDVTVEFSWYGGGTGWDGGPQTTVEFWLSEDGLIPASGVSDSTHLMVYETIGSPGMLLNEAIQVTDFQDLAPGQYVLIANAVTEGIGSVITKSDQTHVICDERR